MGGGTGINGGGYFFHWRNKKVKRFSNSIFKKSMKNSNFLKVFYLIIFEGSHPLTHQPLLYFSILNKRFSLNSLIFSQVCRFPLIFRLDLIALGALPLSNPPGVPSVPTYAYTFAMASETVSVDSAPCDHFLLYYE